MSAAGQRPLRIVHAIARLNVGGAALHVLQLAAEQRRRGHTVLVVAGSLPRGEESMEYVAERLGVAVRHVPELQRELSPRRDAAAVRALVRILREHEPDVLHTHAAKAGATGRIAARLARRGRPRALVHTFHGHVLEGYFGTRRERVFRLAERLLARRTDVLVAVSDEVRADLVRLAVAPFERFEVVRYGFDLAALSDPDGSRRARSRAELGLGDSFVVGWAGRLTAIKRPLDLVRTLHVLVTRDDVDATLVLVGDGEDRDAVEALARDLGVAERCRLLGYRTDLSELLPAFDSFLLSSANEGTPVSAIEALASGRPVVSTRVGGTPAVVDDAETGYLVAPGDVGALAGALARLARDPALRSRMGALGSERMLARFDTSRMADELEALYRRAAR